MRGRKPGSSGGNGSSISQLPVGTGSRESAANIPFYQTLAERAFECGLAGMTRPETASRLGMDFWRFNSDRSVVSEYDRGWSEHTYRILNALFQLAVEDRDAKALTYLADKHLKRSSQVETDDQTLANLKHLTALSPEERRRRMVELSKKYAGE